MEQADALLDLLGDVATNRVLVIGDLNSYGEEDPIDELGRGGLIDLIGTRLAETDQYGYVFEGEAGYLDHALATPTLAGRVAGVDIWHINADEARFLGLQHRVQPVGLLPGRRLPLLGPRSRPRRARSGPGLDEGRGPRHRPLTESSPLRNRFVSARSCPSGCIPAMTQSLRKLVVAVAMAFAAVVASSSPVTAGAGNAADRSAKPITLAVIGDVPYGIAQEASFGDLIDEVNDDPKVRVVMHVGDIKSGSTACSDERFAAVRDAFDEFEDPVVYTPGDNEWTDCHRANNGAYDPLERLDAVRSTFFARPGSTMGRRMRVEYQTSLVENVRWIESRVAFATLHVIGSNNGLAPYTGLGYQSPTAEQVAEVEARVAAAISWVDATFDAAEASELRGVVLAMQADTWEPVPSSGQQAIVERIATRTAAFDGQVLLLQGDSHEFVADNPLGLPNFTRIVVHGESLPFEYLRLAVDPRDPQLFSWERVQVTEP